MKKNTLLIVAFLFSIIAKAQIPNSFLDDGNWPCPVYVGLQPNYDVPLLTPGAQFLWSTGDTTQQVNNVWVNQLGMNTYWLRITYNGQSKTDTMHINIEHVVSDPLFTNSGMCKDTVTVTSQVQQAGTIYQWRSYQIPPNGWVDIPNANSNTFSTDEIGYYQLSVSVPNHPECVAINNIEISVNPKKYFRDTALCLDNNTVMFVDNLNTNCTYIWDNNPQANTAAFTIDQSVVHAPTSNFVTITNTNPIGGGLGCTVTDTLHWSVNPTPTPLLSGDKYICSGNTDVVLKDSAHLYTHIWSYNGNVLSTADSIVVNYTGAFHVKTMDINAGCSVTDTLFVYQTPPPFINDYGWNLVGNCAERTYIFSPNFQTNNIKSFYWDFSDGSTTNYPSPIHTFPAGTDSFEVTFITEYWGVQYNDCNRSIAKHKLGLQCNGATSINDLENEVALHVFPNPASDAIHVQANEMISSIEVYDITGRLVYKSASTGKAHTIITSNWNAGMYQIKIMIKDKGSVMKKIVKQ